ncbi:inactive pancreatic lipase-related protein 1 [Trichonephila clavipes]|nr:inactive pancreatic lipase-related protein 1 [Trichonephila clavipes]
MGFFRLYRSIHCSSRNQELISRNLLLTLPKSCGVKHACLGNVSGSTDERRRRYNPKSTSSSFEYGFLLLPPETDRKRRFPVGLMFTKPSVQRHLLFLEKWKDNLCVCVRQIINAGGKSERIKSFRRCKSVHAPELFTESINMDCPFYGYFCDSYANFSSGQCDKGCGSDMSRCAPMGYKSEEWLRFTTSEPVTMFLETGLDEPYCRYHYHISVLLSSKEELRRHRNETGLLFLRITGTRGRTALLQATPKPVVFTRGNALEFLMSSGNLGRLLRVDVLWTPLHSHPPSDEPFISIHSIRLTNLETTYR